MGCGCKSLYKRKVDAVFPSAPDDGINQTAMGHLNFYASTHQFKLPKIARYINRRMDRARARERRNEVIAGAQIYHELITQCHNDVHLFLDPLFDAIERLLESKDNDYQTQAVQVLSHFAAFEVRTPTYSRRVETLVSLLASMSFPSNTSFPERLAGLNGLHSLLIKAKHGDMALWQPFHLNKMIPALLINLESNHRRVELEQSLPTAQANLGEAAERAVKELLIQAELTNIKDVLSQFVDYWIQGGHLRLNGTQDKLNFAQHCIKLCLTTLPASQHHIVLDTTFKAAPNSSKVDLNVRIGVMHLVWYMLRAFPKISSQRTFIATVAQALQQLRYLDGADIDLRTQLMDVTQDTLLSLAKTLSPTAVVEVLTFMMGQVATSGAEVQVMIVSMAVAVSDACELLMLNKTLPLELCSAILASCTANQPELRNAAVSLLDSRLRCKLEEPATEHASSSTASSGQPRRSTSATMLTNLLDGFSRSVMQRQSARSQQVVRGQTPLAASRRDRQYFGKLFDSLVAGLFSAVAKAESTEETSLACWGDVALRMATVFGQSYAMRTISAVLALQESDASPKDAIRAAFVAVFLKRVAVAYGLVNLQAAVDMAVDDLPAVAEVAAQVGPKETFGSTSTSTAAATPPVVIVARADVKLLLEQDGFAVEHLHHLDKLFVQSATLTLGTRRESGLTLRNIASEDAASVISTGTAVDNIPGSVSFAQLKASADGPAIMDRAQIMADIFASTEVATISKPSEEQAAIFSSTFRCERNLLSAHWQPAVQVTVV